MKRLLPIALLAPFALAVAQEAGPRAPTPGHAVILLKQAWEASDLNAVAARYVEPGASYVRSDLAALRRVEDARADLAAAIAAKLGPAAAEEIVPPGRKPTSPLAGATVTLLASRVRNDRATTKFRVATREGERFFRYPHVLVDGDWKVVLASLDGTPLDAKGLARFAAGTKAHARAADLLARLTKDVRAGALSGRDSIHERIVAIFDAETRAVDDGARVRVSERHEND